MNWRGTGADRWLLGLVLLLIVAGWWFSPQLLAGTPKSVEIFHGNREVASYPWPQKGSGVTTIRIPGDIGVSVIALSAQGVRVVDAPCRGKYCVRSGMHRRAGEMIVCLPNRVTVRITGVRRVGGIDALAQ
ncbi:MAG: NusG domain II-containing protein [Mariprofundales bacterium]|nr:NusG domain II-containing protein [Mariprofundales bacterium]